MAEYTEDPTTIITERTEEYVQYENTDGKKWRIYGKCIACGLCENIPSEIPSVTTHENKVTFEDGTVHFYTRKLIWGAEPGTEWACIEEGFENRKDIPITPDLVNNIEQCPLEGIWIDGN